MAYLHRLAYEGDFKQEPLCQSIIQWHKLKVKKSTCILKSAFIQWTTQRQTFLYMQDEWNNIKCGRVADKPTMHSSLLVIGLRWVLQIRGTNILQNHKMFFSFSNLLLNLFSPQKRESSTEKVPNSSNTLYLPLSCKYLITSRKIF